MKLFFLKKLDYILSVSGFSDQYDLVGTFAPYINKMMLISAFTGGITAMIDTYMGMSFMLWLFFTAASAFDLGIGFYANVIYLKEPYESKKMFRGIFKAFILMSIIFLTNTLKRGVFDSEIEIEWIHTTLFMITTTIHYFFVLLIGLYILLGIAENGAKLEIPFCVSMVRILKIKIKTTEDQI